MCKDTTLLSVLFHQRFEPPLQPSAINPPPLPQILSFPLQQGVPPLHPIYECAPPPPLSVSLQGQGQPPLVPSSMRPYVPLLSALILWKCVHICHPLADPAPLPHFSLAYSMRRASSSDSSCVCSSSSSYTICLASRVRHTPSSNFNCERL